ncbi:MAG: multiheme c-type cytochrome [Melioribacteraceae bacterium]|nr:MAG: multiheme c-type cytochrome [Melioribacteraceae bacterium]
MAEKDSLQTQKMIVGIFSILLVVILIIVAGVEMKHSVSAEPIIEISGVNKRCVDCHTSKGVAVKAIEHWKQSVHAEQNISCIDCHTAQEGEFDAFYCPESDLLVAKHPTPKDCAECHETEVAEFTNSKHAHQFWLISNGDRAVFEFPMATKHGCEQCHNIGNMWPDGSVGECDACHAKHTFSKAVARQPETCGECHVGPDHPHIEIYLESKHGNIFRATEKNMDLSFTSNDHDEIPIDVPVCTTCHMDSDGNQPMTHNVSARLAWESQAPWSYRTVWDDENLGDWQMKRGRMESVCKKCHSSDFVEVYLLTADLVNLQYNEMRREFVRWNKKLTANGIVDRLELNDKFYSDPVLNGWDEVPEDMLYKAWHHEGRRFRHGAEMMGADYTQWHGVWEMQEAMVEMLTWAAEKGDPEAKRWVESNHPEKFIPFALYDIPGNAWGINSHSNTTPVVYNNNPDYWERIYQNVETAYQAGLLSDKQWQLWVKRYNDKEHYQGTKYKEANDSLYQFYLDRNKKDTEAFTKQAVELKLKGEPFWKY